MHNNFVDKNRRLINLKDDQVRNVLPEYFAGTYPKFITLLESYYEWQDENNATELLNHLFASRDINETDITLLTFIEDELLLGESYFKGFGTTDAELRAAANFSNILFRSKGTKFAIEWFFRSFYGTDVEVIYPKESVFRIGLDASRIGPDSLHYLTDDKLYQTWALLIKAGVPISQWKDLFKLFSHPAGMYLGGEVLLLGEALQNILDDQLDPVSVRTSETYALSVDVDSAVEGTAFNFALDANNLRNNFGTAKWYVEHVDTEDADFSVPPPSILNPQEFYIDPYLSLTAARGTFNVQTVVDDNELEGWETFNVKVLDKDDTLISTSLINVQDLAAGYTVTPENDLSNEGEEVEFTITGTNVPFDGSTTLYWWVSHGVPAGAPEEATNDSDFVGLIVPTNVTRQPISIVDDSGRFTLQSRIDSLGAYAPSPGAEDTAETNNQYFEVIVETQSGIEKTKTTHGLVDVIPAFGPADGGASLSFVEGTNLEIPWPCDPTTVGETVYWTDNNTDPRLVNNSGSFVLTSTNDTYLLTSTIVSDLKEDEGNWGIEITATTNSVAFNARQLENTIEVPLTNQPATYDISFASDGASSFLAQEGDTLTLTFDATNLVEFGSTVDLYWYVEHVTTDDADFTPTPPLIGSRSTITLNDTQTGTINPTLVLGTQGDGNENFVVRLYDAASGGTELADLPITILSGTAVNDLTVTTTAVNEGDNMSFTFTTNNSDGTYYYWMDDEGQNYINAFDFLAANAGRGTYHPISSRGTFTVTGGSGTVNLAVAADQTREGNETFKIRVSETASSGTLALSLGVLISDTSVPSYTITSNSPVVEGQDLIVTIVGGATETLYLEVASPVGTRVPTKQYVVNHNGVTSTVNIGTLSETPYSGPQNYEFDVSLNTYKSNVGSVELPASPFAWSMLDATPVYSLAVDNLTPSEGDTITYTFSGQNHQAVEYYYRPSNVISRVTIQDTPAATSTIYLNSVSGLTIGMSTIDPNIGGTITNIGTNFVVMSQNLTYFQFTGNTIGVGTSIHFAQPSVWDNYTGSPYGSFTPTYSGGTQPEDFTVTFATDDDFGNETITMGVYSLPYDTSNLLKSRAVTLDNGVEPSNPPALPINGTWNHFDTLFTATNVLTTSKVSFGLRPDGFVYVDGDYLGTGGLGKPAPTADPVTGTYPYFHKATQEQPTFINATLSTTPADWIEWVDGAKDGDVITGSDYEARMTILSTTGDYLGLSGDLGTWVNLGSGRYWTLSSQGYNNFTGTANVELEIRRTTGNTTAESTQFSLTSSGFQVLVLDDSGELNIGGA